MRAKPSPAILILISFFHVAVTANPCNPGSLPDPLTLRPDQLTVLINGFSERRLPLLRSLAASYSSHSSVAAVLILWGNPSTPASLLANALRFSSSGAPISIHRHPTPSLNARFLPRAAIRTRAVAVCDDDVEINPTSLAFVFSVWRSREESLVGFFARSHDFDLSRRAWIYTVQSQRYSIILTKFMILKTDYLSRYSCGSSLAAAARRLVDTERNCEDILMNFVAAMEGGVGPVLVEGRRRVRDWGDPRNSGNGTEEVDMRGVGLSSIGDHRKRRGDCITEFHRLLGRMPLRIIARLSSSEVWLFPIVEELKFDKRFELSFPLCLVVDTDAIHFSVFVGTQFMELKLMKMLL